MKKFRLFNQRIPAEHRGEGNFPPSLAEPGQSLTPQEILRNFVVTGRTGLDTVPGDVDEDGSIDDMAYMDKLEREDAKRRVASRLNEYKLRNDQLAAASKSNGAGEHVETGERKPSESEPVSE